MTSVRRLVQRGDLDELVRDVDAAAGRGDLDRVLELRRACLEAVASSGRQLWGPAAYAAYRLALEGPPDLAVDMLLEAEDRHMLGPLTEVVAQHHTWAVLRDRLPSGPVRGAVAVERVLRGEDLRGDGAEDVDHLDVPAHWLDWEGQRPRLRYGATGVVAPAPMARPQGPAVAARTPGPPLDDPELVEAWEPLVAPWTTAEGSRMAVAVVDGPVTGAVARVAPGSVVESIALGDAVAAMTWASSSGGAGRRRRGGAAGRSTTWWALRTLVAHEPDSPPSDLGADLDEWSWYRFGGLDDQGWWLRIAAEHPEGWSLAIDAWDPPPDDLVLPVPVLGPADPTEEPPAPDPFADFDRALQDLEGG